jgi:DNA-binding XRE family transcriptional regulator
MNKENSDWSPQDTGNWHEVLKQKILADPEGLLEYEAFGLNLDIAEKMRKARKRARITQEVIAERMGTKKTVITRLEAAGGKSRHSPSLTTLAKYASAIGCHLDIRFVKN